MQNKTDSTDLILMGRIGAPFGVKGQVRVQSYTDPLENIFAFPIWHLLQNGRWSQYELNDCQHHAKGLVVQLKGIDSREDIQKFTHADIYVSKSGLPECPTGEYYWAQIEGLTVLNTEGHLFGRVAFIYEAGAQENMVVIDDNKNEIHIPFLMNDVVKEVDLDQKKLLVDWSKD